MKRFALKLLVIIAILAAVAVAIAMVNEGGLSEKMVKRSLGAAFWGCLLMGCGGKGEEQAEAA